MKIFLIALAYFVIAAFKFFLNLTRWKHCNKLLNEYGENYKTNPALNYPLISPAKRHFSRTGTRSDIYRNQHILADSSYSVFEQNSKCFLHAMGIYQDRMFRAPLWLYDDVLIKLSVIHIPYKLKENAFTAIIFALIEGFVLYLGGLALDTSGVGRKILDYLYAFLTVAWQRIWEWIR